MPTAHVNGQTIAYEDTGGNGPAIIFSHGLMMDGAMFAPQVEALRGAWRCIVWDERGHGGTATDSLEPFTYYDSADDLAALLAHLDIEQAVLAGMSQGGFLSLRCALTHPEVVRALILMDTQAGVEDPSRLPHYHQLVERWIAHDMPDDVADFVEATILGDGWSGAPAWRAKWKRMAPVNLVGCMATLGGRDDITARLGEIKAPALVVHGDADAAISPDLAQRLTDGLADARLVVVEGAGHAANLTHPAPVNRAIDAFLGALRP